MLSLMDLDIVLLELKSYAPEEDNRTTVIAKSEKWGRSNWLSVMIIKRSISYTIRDSISDNGNATDFPRCDRREV